MSRPGTIWTTAMPLLTAGLVMAAAGSAPAGKLGSFEKAVGASTSGSSSNGSGSLSSFESSTSSSTKEPDHSPVQGYRSYYPDCWYCRYNHHCLFHHSYRYFDPAIPASSARAIPFPGGTNQVEVVMREPPGDTPLLPTARFDGAWQAVEDDVDAYDFALEIGYSAVAVRGRITQYREDDPDDTLDLSSLLLLWRIPLSRNVEADAGLGGAELDGTDNQSGLNVGLALRGWIPDRRLGLEYRGEFMDVGNGLNSHEFGILLHLKVLAIRGGYRWLHTTGDSLDGPFVGAAVFF